MDKESHLISTTIFLRSLITMAVSLSAITQPTVRTLKLVSGLISTTQVSMSSAMQLQMSYQTQPMFSIISERTSSKKENS